jgi:hypothetical protein
MSVFCNICIDDTDLDLILSKLSTLKTKIADWVEYKKDQALLANQQSGLQSSLSTAVTLGNIEMEYVVGNISGSEELVQSTIELINEIYSRING